MPTQAGTAQLRVDLAGSTWIAFTDQVSHAMAGQYQLEQTFLVPGPMLDEQRSPLRILERLMGRPLV